MPPIPTGAGLGSALGTVAAPLTDALAKVADSMKKVGDAVRAVLPVLDTLGNEFRALGERFKVWFRDHIGVPLFDSLRAIGRGIQFALPTTVLDYFKNAAGKVGEAAGATGRAVLGLAAAAPVAAAAVAAVGLAMVQFVGKANPAVAEQFNLALNDVMAVIGQALTPVLQVVTQVTRLFGDALAGVLPALGAVLGEIASSLMPIFEALFEAFAISLGFLADVLKIVAPVIKIIADGIKTVFDWWLRAIKYLLGLVGIELGDTSIKKGSSTGAAVRQAGHDSVEGLIKKAQASAFSLGTASGPNYAKMTADNTAGALGKLDALADKLTALPENLAQRIVDAMNPFKGDDGGGPNLFDRITDPAGSAARDYARERDTGGGLGLVGEFARRAMGRARGAADGPGTVKPAGP
jgi:hypothetical protein